MTKDEALKLAQYITGICQTLNALPPLSLLPHKRKSVRRVQSWLIIGNLGKVNTLMPSEPEAKPR